MFLNLIVKTASWAKSYKMKAIEGGLTNIPRKSGLKLRRIVDTDNYTGWFQSQHLKLHIFRQVGEGHVRHQTPLRRFFVGSPRIPTYEDLNLAQL
jgi:hypothetical protein